MIRSRLLTITIGCLVAALLAGPTCADDWPTYKKDPGRSSVATENLAFPLVNKWAYQPSQPPMPAWPEPGKELHRMDFDYAFQPVAADGLVYFASSADDTVRALNATTGALAWRFTASGPIRFAPTIARQKAYIASDDGWIYCLDAKTGKLVWRFHAAPDDDQVLGNGRMISRWPCRSGPLVVGDILYCAAGMWPTEGAYIYALNADTGQELWCNDSSGAIYTDLPHPGASGFSGVAPQGYLLVRKDTLLVPTGRCVPAAFDRHTGRLLYHKPAIALYHGAAWLTSADDLYFNAKNRFQNPSQAYVGEAQPVGGDGMFAYSFASGEREFTLNGKYRVLASGGVLYTVGGGSIQAFDLSALRKSKRTTPETVKWTIPHPARVYCLAMAGQALLTGNRDSITAFDATTGKLIWEAEVDGQVRGLAISDGRLIAATHEGHVLCFEQGPAGDAPATVKEATSPISASDEHKRTAARIVEQSGKTQGYAMVIGEPDCRLSEALAAQTDLRIISVLPGSSDAAAEREHLLDTGLYGSRVWAEGVDDLARLPFAPYFTDLVVVSGKAKGVSPAECYRVLRPCGGALCFVGVGEGERAKFITDTNAPNEEVSRTRTMIVRGALAGAGEWRYPWADGGRSGIGKDSRVRLPLEVLWFGGPGPDRLMDRHLMTSPPVSANGRVFMTGQHEVISFDAYNGRELWNHHLPGVGRKYAQYYSSGLVADDDTVYAVQGNQCHRLNQATGETVRVYSIPKSVIRGTPAPVVPEYMHVQWPEAWQVIGPFPKGTPPLPPEDLKTIPDRVTVAGEEHAATPLKAVNHLTDFTNLYGGYGAKPLGPGEEPAASPQRGPRPDLQAAGKIAYAFASINCPKAGKLLIGAGADWWMQWYLDGKPIFDTLKGGNEPSRHNWFSRRVPSPTDYVFDVDVTAGEHVLAVVVKSGSGGWNLASASMAQDVDKVMPIESGLDPNLPDLKRLVWGYVSVADDLLLGSYAVPIAEGQAAESHLIWRSESKAVFALDKNDGSLRWVYRPRPDRTVSNIEIAFGDGRLFLLDSTSKADSVRARRRGQKTATEVTLVALDLADGTELWRQDDVPWLPDRNAFSRIKSNPTHLLMGIPNWGHLVYANGVVVLGANAAYDPAAGKKLWQRDIRPGKLPIVLGDWLITGLYAYDLRTAKQRMTEDLLTGQEVPWRYTRAYGCGPVNGCEHLLFFRSGADGFFDMDVGGTTNFGGVRSNCARSLIAAHGLLIHPEGYSGCCCSYNYQTSLALVPTSDQSGTWYVFPRGSGAGPIKHIAINLGAPGDQKSSQGTAWLGFPRPMIATACPAPVTVLMQNASCYHRRRVTASIKGTDSPWVYSSGLRGSGQIAIGLVVQPNLVMPTREASPAIDGKLDDACWDEVKAVPFENTPFTILGASVDLRLFRDAENLYFAYHRKPISDPQTNADEAILGKSDGFEIYIADGRRKRGIRFAVKRNGSAFARFGTVDRYRKIDPTWTGAWTYEVQQTPAEWTAEVAIPLTTLTESGIDPKNLNMNCMSQNLTRSGLEAIFLVDPMYGADFRRCVRFRRVVAPPPDEPKKRSFTVRLHFAEIDGAQAGQRVFDVAIQGETVLADLDILKEARGRNTALIKEFSGIEGGDQILIQLTPKGAPDDAKMLPVISGVQITEEEG